MRHPLLTRSFLFLIAVAAPLLWAAPVLARVTQQPELDLPDEIRIGVHWLRTAEGPDGSYGGGVTGTAWALRAFATCPDHYRPIDGPFIRNALAYLQSKQAADGAICDAKATGEARAEQTRLAAAALAMYADEKTADALKRSLAFLGTAGAKGPGWDPEPPIPNAEKAVEIARALIGRRDPQGFWDGIDGKVIVTAQSTIELCNANDVIRKAHKSSAPSPVVALPQATPAERAKAHDALLRGAEFLAKAADKGRFGAPGNPDSGITAMVLAALTTVPEPRPADIQKVIDEGLAWLLTLRHEDGSIHDGKLANYCTSAVVMALVRANKPEYKPVIDGARKYLQTLQLDEGEHYSEGDLYYGGIGYGGSERPDLSNLQMALEALSASGLKNGDPTYQKALKFLERCQNRSESNDIKVIDGKVTIVSGNDGGGYYAPADSKAGFVELEGGTKVPRSYGSMTYALLKCFVFAGLAKDDPRMKAAWDWCQKNYTLDVNPGFVATQDPTAAYQGLYYYLYSMAHALALYGSDSITDAAGKAHSWRGELCGRIVAMQSKIDGSWINQNSPRWWEGNPILATSYAIMTLDAAMPR